MNLMNIIKREQDPQPWSEGDNIPWNEPGFSARMLREHLSQDHDAASRRASKIDAHVEWIHDAVLGGQASRILDLGCGPGLYAQRLAARGHTCVGIDFSPASIAYARQQAQASGSACRYELGDLRQAPFGAGYDLAMLLYGELNVFCPDDARLILNKARTALRPGGILLLEPHTPDAIRAMGQEGRDWFASDIGLFAAKPHLVLTEHIWREAAQAVTIRHYVLDAATGQVSLMAQSMQRYTQQAYIKLLTEIGFGQVTVYPSLVGAPDPSQQGLLAITARKTQEA